MEKAFPLVGNWTSWKVSNKIMVQIEEDPQIGAKGNYKLSEALLLKLHEVGIFPLWEAASQEQRNAWSQGWLSIGTLNIEGILVSGADAFGVAGLNLSRTKLSGIISPALANIQSL